MNNLNRIKFLIKNLFGIYPFNQKMYIMGFINNKKLRKNKHYSFAINKLMECMNFPEYNIYILGYFIDTDSLQKSEKFDVLLKTIFDKLGDRTIQILDHERLRCKDRYDDIMLEGLKFTNTRNLNLFLELCNQYYKFVDFDINPKHNELDRNNYEYMMKKFLSVKDECNAGFYFEIFRNVKLLELDEYTNFVDRIFEIKDERKLELLGNAIEKCARNYKIDIFPILQRLNEIDDSFVLDKINNILKCKSLNILSNTQMISLYILHLNDFLMLAEFEKMLSNELIITSDYFNTIMDNVILVRNHNVLFELRKLFNNIYNIPEYLDIICKLDYTDARIYDILKTTNSIITLLNYNNTTLLNETIIYTLFNKILTQNNSKTILECLNLLEQEILIDIQKDLILDNTNKLINSICLKIICSKNEEDEQNKIKKIDIN